MDCTGVAATGSGGRSAETTDVAIVHDYVTQRGGAERVVLAMLATFPGATLYTSLFEPATSFDEFRATTVRTTSLNGLGVLRRHHRLALPVLARAFSTFVIDEPVAVCSSSGWAHGAMVSGRKIVYCHTPARWLYQSGVYLGAPGPSSQGAVHRLGRGLGLAAVRRSLRAWDERAAASAHRYLANSTIVRDRIQQIYGVQAEVLPPPHQMDTSLPREQVPGVEEGAFLCVARLLPYKNVDPVIDAFRSLPDERLLIVGRGPLEAKLRAAAPPNVRVLGTVSEGQLRWLYHACHGLIAASYEDFGLTPLEAAAWGKPTAALRWGGYLDTIVEGATGVFFDEPEPAAIAEAVDALQRSAWSADTLQSHADRFSLARFSARLGTIVAEELRLSRAS